MGGLAADEGIFLPGNDVTKSKAEAAKAKGDEEELCFEMKGEPKDAKTLLSSLSPYLHHESLNWMIQIEGAPFPP